MYLYLTGRETAISIAEIESLVKQSSPITTVGSDFVLTDERLPLRRMGGTVKMARVLKTVPSTDPQRIKRELIGLPPHEFLEVLEDGKYNLGLSSFGIEFSPRQLTGIGLELKKRYKKTDTPLRLRIVPSKEIQLSNAQVLHNHLYDPKQGAEIVLVRDGTQTIIAATCATQDLDAYTARDQTRPARDTFVGMLPPKLAQILVNLSVGQTEVKRKNQQEGSGQDREPRLTVLDPFCGTGVVLQEALLMGYRAYGSDISPAMVKASQQNLEWLASQDANRDYEYSIELGDATNHTWTQPVDAVATEIFLGEPLKARPSPQKLEQLTDESRRLVSGFLTNIAPQITSGTPLCIAVPAWRIGDGFSPSLSVDDLKELGYTAVSFKYIDEELVYIRENQFTGRGLLTLIKE